MGDTVVLILAMFGSFACGWVVGDSGGWIRGWDDHRNAVDR